MGLLDTNKVLTSPLRGLENTPFDLIMSNEQVDIWEWTDATMNLKLVYRDIYVWAYGSAIWIAKGSINAEKIKVDDFPNLRNFANGNKPVVVKVVACPCKFFYEGRTYGNALSIEGMDCRICVIFSNGQVYHNYPSANNGYDFYDSTWAKKNSLKVADLFTKFDESAIWDLPNRKTPTKDSSLVATGAYYYNPALPANCYEMHPAIGQANGYGNTEGFGATTNFNNGASDNRADIGIRARFFRTNMDDANSNAMDYMGGYIVDDKFTMIATYRSNDGDHPCRMVVFGTQDGGRNWYAMYEFGVNGSYYYSKPDGNDSFYGDVMPPRGLKLAFVGNVGSGVYKIKRRRNVVPSHEWKEPSKKFIFGPDFNIASVSGDESKITITTAQAHGYYEGDIAVLGYQEGVSAGNRVFDFLVNNTADENSGGNGVLLRITNVTTNTFDIELDVHNPDNNLSCRHIHALNKCKDGVSISCGEAYPNGWIMYVPIHEADAYSNLNIAKLKKEWVRLTSTSISFARPLGVLVKQESDGTYCYIGADTSDLDMGNVELAEGRTATIQHNSCGVWKCKIDNLDAAANGELIYDAIETCFGFQEIGGAWIFTGQYGNLAISYDKGATWTRIQLPPKHRGQALAHFSGTTYDKKVAIDNILIQLKK